MAASDPVDALLQHYVRMAETIGQMFAPLLEVVVHDLRTPERSIIAIVNGHVTGRHTGGSATDLGRRLLKGDFPDRLVGYPNTSPNGARLKSASLAVRDESGRLVGVVGFNLDVTYFEQFGRFLEQFLEAEPNPHVVEAEHFDASTPTDDIQEAIDDFVIGRGWSGRTLSNADKREIVGYLYTQGFFKTRGAVSIIARELSLSRPTVYTYKNDAADVRWSRG